MSYDLQVWTSEPFEDGSSLPSGAWDGARGAWSKSGKGWIINVSTNHDVLPEDISEDVNAAIPGVRYLTELSLEPIHAPKTAATLLRRAAEAIAKSAHGVVFDPQADTLSLPSGVKRFAAQPREERISQLEFSWWFAYDDLVRRDHLERLLLALEEVPEVLPRRYGLYEPPQFELEKVGRPHLVDFLERHVQESVIWYPHRPMAGLYLNVRSPSRWQRLGQAVQYRSQRLSFGVERVALGQPGWPLALRRLWRRVSRELRPFYGEVRTLHGYVRSGSRISVGRETETNPTRSWWWKGIPPRVGHAFVIGPPYADLWPGLDGVATADGALRFVETSDWSKDDEASALVGGVPLQLASREHTKPAELAWPEPVYPPMFPFPRETQPG